MAMERFATAHVGAGAVPPLAEVVEHVLVQLGQTVLAASGAAGVPAPLP